ncbi:uncharacterized protein FOMMEDRAFT_132375 [Fomitiporia mediterranea MF3/22]|uniref:uncharacterized protein n=1 Tax=Fomitiporia mediterranea (strain MF3/22) TaxID=694068 RepID=UPI0004407756|nr:uncharacterized protein FOMMEDRAFT_132375 [Fomitiporia mediterranea MF3/22]EJD05954.1 hypothetical protein FOMMEDRAFT_132375 [Fomitiporia mediterranea MF3/22]
MHRFRRKSDARRSELPPPSSPSFSVASSSRPHPPFPIVTQHVQVHPPPEPPSLPPVSDFRTSLILPELTRRFTLLRSSSGAPYSLEDLRNRFAEQRAKGAENQISEEEEDMLLDMLSRIRAHGTGHGGPASKTSVTTESNNSSVRSDPSSTSVSSNDAASSASSTVRQSTQSTTTMSSAPGSSELSHSPVSPSSRSAKRHSNNLFGGGQLRDIRYMRKSSNRTISSSRSALSSTQSESTTENIANALIDSYSDGHARPITPENSTSTINAPSSPISAASSDRSMNLSMSSSIEEGVAPLAGSSALRLSRQLTTGQVKRMSMSLEEAIRKIEEEADDQVLVPRSTTSAQQNGNAEPGRALALTTDDTNSNSAKAITEASNESSTMSWLADVDTSGPAGAYRSPSPYRTGRSTSPVPRVPGYIPGMPRPVTPARDNDLEDVRSLSITPRAAASSPPLSAGSTLLRQAVNNSPTPYGARPKSPHSSVRDRYGNPYGSEHTSLSSHWRRPSSPLSSNSNAFQSLNGGSRPSTPSNVTWNVSARESGQSSKPLGRNGTLLGHNRTASNSSVGDSQSWIESPIDDAPKTVLRIPRPIYSPGTSDDGRDSEVRNKFLSNGSVLSASALAFVDYDPTSELSNSFGMSSSPSRDLTRSTSVTSTLDEGTRAKQRILSPLLTPPTSPFARNFDQNPLVISRTSNNSSRSSLVSVGSSYHSTEDDGAKFLLAPDRMEPAWHDVPISVNVMNQGRTGTRGNPPADDPEHLLRQYTGLTKLDLLSIQNKLLEASQARAKSSEVRASSTLRRRRPSTAQSIHSTGGQPSRTTSPAPVHGLPWAPSVESTVKANALLTSVVNSIQPSEPTEPVRDESEDNDLHILPSPPVLAPIPTSSPGRRNKDLAEILFGVSESEPVPSLPEVEPEPEHAPVQEPAPKHEPAPLDDQGRNTEEDRPRFEFPQRSAVPPKVEDIGLTQLAPNHGLELTSDSGHTADSSDLIRQVQERTEAAMAQLRRSPQQGRFPIAGSQITKKKINLQDISAPLLVQSSTSIDKIPTVSTSPLKPTHPNDGQRTVKMSLSRRLRNTLRSKNAGPNGDEVTPWTLDNTSSSFTNSPQVGNRSLTPSKGSVTDLYVQPKLTNVSPPASAGPNLKTFMSRFRKKGQQNGPMEHEQKHGLTSTMPSNAPSQSAPANGRHSFQLPPSSAPLLSRSGSISQAVARIIPTAPSLSRQPTERTVVNSPSSPPASAPSEPTALRQFYEAAQSLGLDQSALNDFLARSNSSAGKHPYPSTSAPTRYHDESPEKPSLEPIRASSPVIPELFIQRPGADHSGNNTTLRERASSPVPAPTPRRVREIADSHGNVRNTVVRRTLIFPSTNSSTTDLASLSRKATTKSYKRASNLSVQSNRSIHERIPTPPPPKAKRQSIDPSPPVPSLPSPLSLSNSGRLSSSRLTPEIPIEKSPYDSFYDMYIGDRTGSVQSPELSEPPKSPLDESLPEVEEGQALEVIELANGETIWSIVNGLRADDVESIYQRRGSVDSDYSSMPLQDSESEQLFFKEHARTGSKGSNISISNFARRKSQQAARPETKVFHSSSTHIGRLIEQLARNTEAATFNIKPNPHTHNKQGSVGSVGNTSTLQSHSQPFSHSHIAGGGGHSHSGSLQTMMTTGTTSDSDTNWTVEERLERMLDSVNPSS